MKKVIISYNNIKINPRIRNFFRAVFLLIGYKVEFVNGKNDCRLICGDFQWDIEEKIIIDILCLLDNETVCLDEKSIIDIYEQINIGCKNKLKVGNVENKQYVVECILYTINILSFYYTDKLPVTKVQEEFKLLWDENYYDLYNFKLTEKKEVNSTNKNEAAHYLDIFNNSSTGIKYIDNAIESLVSIIPDDAELILDLGAGPGYVNRKIPPYYSVLAMDIDEEILSKNIRPTSIGDCLNIPLESKSVDMIITTDMLEHIPIDKLNVAINELERVSKKYIYIQVPNNENLLAGMAHCTKCNNVWHVNYHKSSFSYNKIINFLSNKWKVKTVNYTGDVSYYKKDFDNYETLHRMGIESYNVENWTCPICNNKSDKLNYTYYDTINQINFENSDYIEFPNYSEIGILFESIEIYDNSEQEDNINKFSVIELCTNKMNFVNDVNISDVYTKQELIPTLICNEHNFEKKEEGYEFRNINYPMSSWLSIAFPFSVNENEKIEIIGWSEEEDILQLCSINVNDKEYIIKSEKIGKGKFNIVLVADLGLTFNRLFLRVYFSSKKIIFTEINVHHLGIRYNRYISNDSNSRHLELKKNNILNRYFIPNSMYIDVLEKRENIKDEFNPGKSVLDYIKNIKEYLNKLTSEKELEKINFENKLIDINSELETKNAIINSLECNLIEINSEIKSKDIIINSIENDLINLNNIINDKNNIINYLESNLINIKSENEKLESIIFMLEQEIVNLKNDRDIQRYIINLFESNIAINNINTKRNKNYIKLIFIKFFRKLLLLSKKIIKKIPFLYNFLVNIGVKRLYNNIKLKIKGGEKYE